MHTKGPWEISKLCSTLIDDKRGRNIASAGGYVSNVEDYLPENEANAHLIAAAPDGLQVAQDTYLWLLCNLPMDLRIHSQQALCSLRDYIAKAINKTVQEVQENFEVQAVIRKAKGE